MPRKTHAHSFRLGLHSTELASMTKTYKQTSLRDVYQAGYRLEYLKATFTAQAVAAMFGRSLLNLPTLARG